MKRNFLLTIVLVGLGFYTYQVEELGGIKKRALDDKKHKIIDESFLGEMKEIKGKSFHLVKRGPSFQTSGGQLVDVQRLQKYLDILGKMKVKRYLDEEINTDEFFPADSPVLSFKFDRGEVRFKLGNKLKFDQSFYMEVEQDGKRRRMIALDSSANEGTYDKETFHRNPEKYLRFKTMILLGEEFFVDTHLFQREYELALRGKPIDWKVMRFENRINRDFTINLDKGTTYPAPPIGINFSKTSLRDFLNELVSFSGTKWLDEGKLKEKVATFEVVRNDGVAMTIDLYKKMDANYGAFAKIGESEKVLAFSPKNMRVFLGNVQDFWKLRAMGQEKPKELVMKIDQKEIPVQLEYGKVFTAKTKTTEFGEAINSKFKDLADLLTEREADYISFTTPTENEPSRGFDLSINSGSNDFRVMLKAGELVLINKKSGYNLHYQMDAFKTLGSSLKDFFLK